MFVKQRFCAKIDRTMILFVFYSSSYILKEDLKLCSSSHILKEDFELCSSSYIFKEDLEELYKEKL
ncbi:hypothetical protein B1J93_15480 [Leptospira kirschneri serovar Pomona]|uniref:Uncharacterized protein n=1 Tax=Leptospira kirschneri serovar Pomona TaxID=561005 RepID=A0A1T1DIS0_9LEPT|nr:hypothetical protein B1J93_15480 [Leptospira kirschneri serovar Pomona]